MAHRELVIARAVLSNCVRTLGSASISGMRRSVRTYSAGGIGGSRGDGSGFANRPAAHGHQQRAGRDPPPPATKQQWRPASRSPERRSSIGRLGPSVAPSSPAANPGPSFAAPEFEPIEGVPPRSGGGNPERAAGAPVPVRDLLQELGIALPKYSAGSQRTSCPKCLGGNSREKSLAVTIKPNGEGFVYNCFRATCGFKGGHDAKTGVSSGGVRATNARSDARALVSLRGNDKGNAAYTVPRPSFDASLTQEAVQFFFRRGISMEVLERNQIATETTFSPMMAKRVSAVAFPYYENGQLVNVKYRHPTEKVFWQVKNAKKILYGLDDIVNESVVIIVEGEVDKLAMEQAGFRNCVSVPDGAPAQVSDKPVAPQEDKKFSYVWNCRTHLDHASKILIATDADGPGQALGEELARRLGKERCWSVAWPDGCKDANETLQRHGAAGVVAAIEQPEAFPIRGLFDFKMFQDEVLSYYGLKDLDERRGVSTGWPGLDEYYRVVPGELTIVTGVPNSGKSEWIDALLYNIAHEHGWCFAMCR